MHALVILSGGQDSTTCLYSALYDMVKGGDERITKVSAITFDYGQRHNREIECAINVAMKAEQYFGLEPDTIDHRLVSVPDILQGTSPLVSANHLEQYPDGNLHDGIEKTFVPMRNQFFLTVAANRAFVMKADVLITGVCQEDFGGYPDCRRTFIDSLELTCNLGTFTGEPETRPPLRILTPLMYLSKAESIRLAVQIGAYMALEDTQTGYDGAYPPTGKDHATVLRAKGFVEAGLPDPLVMKALDEGLMDNPGTQNYTDPEAIAMYMHLRDAWFKAVGEG